MPLGLWTSEWRIWGELQRVPSKLKNMFKVKFWCTRHVYSHHGKTLHFIKGFGSFKYQSFLITVNQKESVEINQSFRLLLSEISEQRGTICTSLTGMGTGRRSEIGNYPSLLLNPQVRGAGDGPSGWNSINVDGEDKWGFKTQSVENPTRRPSKRPALTCESAGSPKSSSAWCAQGGGLPGIDSLKSGSLRSPSNA